MAVTPWQTILGDAGRFALGLAAVLCCCACEETTGVEAPPGSTQRSNVNTAPYAGLPVWEGSYRVVTEGTRGRSDFHGEWLGLFMHVKREGNTFTALSTQTGVIATPEMLSSGHPSLTHIVTGTIDGRDWQWSHRRNGIHPKSNKPYSRASLFTGRETNGEIVGQWTTSWDYADDDPKYNDTTNRGEFRITIPQ